MAQAQKTGPVHVYHDDVLVVGSSSYSSTSSSEKFQVGHRHWNVTLLS